MWSVNVRTRKVKFFKNVHFAKMYIFEELYFSCLKDEKIAIKSKAYLGLFFFTLEC